MDKWASASWGGREREREETEREQQGSASLFPWDYICLGLGGVRSLFQKNQSTSEASAGFGGAHALANPLFPRLG